MATWAILALFGLVAGLVAVGGGIWALVRQQVVVDQNGNVTSIEVPFFGKMQTNVPSLVAVFLGVALVGFIINKVTVTDDLVPLMAALSVENVSGRPQLFVGAVPSGYLQVGTAFQGENSSFEMSVDRNGSYNVVAFMLTEIRDGRPVYSLVQGPARHDPEDDRLEFNDILSGHLGASR